MWHWILERLGLVKKTRTAPVPPPPPPPPPPPTSPPAALQLEDGTDLLSEDGITTIDLEQ